MENKLTILIKKCKSEFKKLIASVRERTEQELIVLRYIIFVKMGRRTMTILALRALLLLLGIGIFFTLQSVFTAKFHPVINYALLILFSYLLMKAIWTLGYTLKRIKTVLIFTIIMAFLQLTVILTIQIANTSTGLAFDSISFIPVDVDNVVSDGELVITEVSIGNFDVNNVVAEGDITFASEDEALLIADEATDPAIEGIPLVYPNPFSLETGTEIGYELNKAMDIEIRIYDMRANQIYVGYYNEFYGGAKDYNRVSITASEFGGFDAPAGIYFFVIMTEGTVLGKGKMAVIP